MKQQTLLVCTADDCRKALGKHGRLMSDATRLGVHVVEVGCQKICHGPVVGVEVDERWEWFGRLKSKSAIHALFGLIEDGRMRKPLRKLRDKQRSGKRRR